jgi:hypothetical protein
LVTVDDALELLATNGAREQANSRLFVEFARHRIFVVAEKTVEGVL